VWRALERDEGGLDREEFDAAFTRWWRDHRDSHVAAIGSLDDEPVAMAWLALVDRVPGPGAFVRRCAYVQSVYVERAHRNDALGSALMREVISRAQELELDYLAVHPSPFAFSFYRRLGFDPTSRVLELDFRPPPSAF
jgi:GNAT superfamily N-acetyltransferase